jgi:lysophospholipase L1-like esterase
MTPRRVGLSLTVVALGLLLAGALCEAALRLYAALRPEAGRALARFDPLAVLIEPHGQLGYRQRAGSVFRYSNGAVATSNGLGYRGPAVTVPKPCGTFRIVLLGGSTTHGWGVGDDETIDAHMRQLLSSRHPHRRFDVVNLGFDGYDAHQLVERLRTDGLPLAPDLIIANTGINDVRNARFAGLSDPDPRTLIWEEVLQRLRDAAARGGPGTWARIKHHSYLARFPEIVRQYRSVRPGHPAQGRPEPNLQAADVFERNLERIAALAAQASVPVVFSTPPSSLRLRYEPGATSEHSYWIGDAATTQRVRDELARRMQRVVARQADRGRQATYVAPRLTAESFIDDAHLTPSGNRWMALDLVTAAAPYLDTPGRGVPECSFASR